MGTISSIFSVQRVILPWGEILGRNWDKSLKSFLLAILSHLYKRILLPPTLSKSGLKLVCCMRNPQVWELSRLCQEPSTKLYVHELGFCTACWDSSSLWANLWTDNSREVPTFTLTRCKKLPQFPANMGRITTCPLPSQFSPAVFTPVYIQYVAVQVQQQQ